MARPEGCERAVTPDEPDTGATGSGETDGGRPAEPERTPLDLVARGSGGRRGWMFAVAVFVVAAAVGGIAGLLGGQEIGLVTAAVTATVLVALAWAQSRRTCWLQGTRVVVHTFRTRSVDLRGAQRIDLVVMDVRGARTIGLLVADLPRARGISVPVASYSGTGGRELGILVLRRLADALSASENSGGLVLSELLVAQLRAEARGAPPPDRPLYRLASSAPEGRRLAMRLKPEAVTRFVASLD